MICLTTIFGYFGKYLFNFILFNYKEKFDNLNKDKNKIFNHDRLLFYYIIGMYISSIIISIILYSFMLVFLQKIKRKKKMNIIFAKYLDIQFIHKIF